MFRVSVFCILLIALSACSTANHSKPKPLIQKKHGVSQLPLSCFTALKNLDRLALKYAGTQAGNRTPHQPWLRYNRLSTHNIAVQSATYPTAKSLKPLLSQMSTLAIEGLSLEWPIVPKAQQQRWRTHHQIKTATNEWLQLCVKQHIQRQLIDPMQTLTRLRSIPTDNDYSTLARVAGAYPIAAIPFRYNVIKEQKRLESEWREISNKHWVSYTPMATVSANQTLLKQHAPIWLIDSKTDVNRPGAPYWQGDRLNVNTHHPISYSFVSKALWKQQTITQLNYLIWFSERPKLKRIDWVAGKHDAVIFRVNLDTNGSVIAYDSIHLCGCWYRLFLPENRPFKPINNRWQEPVTMQRITPAKPMAVYISADTHQISYLQPATNITHPIDFTKEYRLAPFSGLLNLPTENGVRSIFNTSGYVAGSERPERWFFWPMGVKNPGALRRFGDHAISFVGRRYFDDPHLLEKVSGLIQDHK